MKYAVLRIAGKQYKVEEGKEFLVDSLGGKEVSPEVLLVVDNNKVSIGTPFVEKAKVSVSTVTEVEKGDKIHVFKYKSKSRYRKKIGFRATKTRLKVDSIN